MRLKSVCKFIRPMKMPKRKNLSLLFLIFLAISFSCVEKKTGKEIQYPPPGKDPGPRSKTKSKAGNKAGVWHTVEPGQTLWRICKAYGVDMEQVVRENDLDDPTQISVGEKIFIPGVSALKKVEPAPQLATTDKPDQPDRFPPEAGAGSGKLFWPVAGGTIFSKFGMRNGQFHEGMDISAPEGAAVYAAEDGKVVYSDSRIRGYGNMIVIKHSGNLSTVYAHNKINLAQEGDFVQRGRKIAEVGRTGTATGNHLHFEVRSGKTAVDPLKYLESAR